jgi:GST-like protein
MRWFETMETRPAVRRNNVMADEIRARMEKAAQGRPPIDIYDTRDNEDRLAQATSRSRRQEIP